MSATTTHSGIAREIALAQSERTARSIHRQACELHRLNTAAPHLLAELKEARRRLATLRVYDHCVFDQQPYGTMSPARYDERLADLIAQAEGTK
jgi:hypothetical protein